MKRFQLQITVEQKESWRVSRIGDVEALPASTSIEIASLVQTENQAKSLPASFRKLLFFQSFSGWLYRLVRSFRGTPRRGGNYPKSLEK